MKNQNGFTLLISVLVVSIMLAVSLGVSNIIRSEIILANTGMQSQIAFYAADAGVECAIYWDTVHSDSPYDQNSASPFATSTVNNPANIDCGDNSLNSSFDVGERDSCVDSPYPSYNDGIAFNACGGADDKRGGRSVFDIKFENRSCARVTVIKRQDDPVVPTTIETYIHADGFSDQDCDSTSPRVFQRSLETTTYE